MPSNKHHPLISFGLIGCSLLLILLTACSATPSSPVAKGSPQVSTATTLPSAPLGAPGCQPPSSLHASTEGFPEVQATATGVQLWALLFTHPPLHARQEIKIVWRMTGAGPFHVSTRGPHSMPAHPTFGPEAHESSNWNRPGEEWGTGFIFPVAGCWDLHASRGKASGDVWLVVQQAA
jgi:hypothetical protein